MCDGEKIVCFMSEGKKILFCFPKKKKLTACKLEKKKTSLLRKKNHSLPADPVVCPYLYNAMPSTGLNKRIPKESFHQLFSLKVKTKEVEKSEGDSV